MCNCIIISKDIKLIGNDIFIGDKEIDGLPIELVDLLTNRYPKITIKGSKIIIDEWQYKDGRFQKTIKGYLHKWLG